jgi:hypothetical protein
MLVDVLYSTPAAVSSLVAGLPAGADEAFEAALAKRPADRPADIEAWAAALAALLEAVRGDAPGWPLHEFTAYRTSSPRRAEGDPGPTL